MSDPHDDLGLTIAKIIGAEGSAITEESSLTNGAWSSLQHLTILADLADRHGFVLDAMLVQELTSVAAIRRFLAERGR